MSSENTKIWDRLRKTDPSHTKGFKRAGGFSGTALKPQWVIQRLTEEFGPCGVGWGVNKPEFQVVPTETDVLVYCTVSAWHGSKDALLWGVGGDKVKAARQNGAFCDDEAFKKAFTDAVMNAFKFAGVGHDIHIGLFDDAKYVSETKAEFEHADEDTSSAKAKASQRDGTQADDRRDVIVKLADAAGVSLQQIIDGYEVKSLAEIPPRKLAACEKRLRTLIETNAKKAA